MSFDEDEPVAATTDDSKIKKFRKWAFTINCDLLQDTRLNDVSYYVEGFDLSSKVNKRNKVVRTTVWVGALEPAEADKRNPYNHRHCAIENTEGGMSKMYALTQLATYLNIPTSSFTCGDGCVVSYSQPVQSWPDYKKYMFKTLPGRTTSDEDKIQACVIQLRRRLKKNPTPIQVKEILIRDNILSFRKVATSAIKQQIELACELGDMYKSDSSDGDKSPSHDDGLKFLSKLSRIDDDTNTMADRSVGFFDDVLGILIEQLSATTRDDENPPFRRVLEIIGLLIMPLFLKRNANDHETKSLVLYGKSKTGKSFIPMQLVKARKLHLIATDAKGVGRFDAPTSSNGFFFDDVPKDILKSTDCTTIKNLTSGDEACVKVYARSTIVRGWTVITCQTELEKNDTDYAAWSRRLLELNFDDCNSIDKYTTVFDIVKRSNVDEMLTFLYYIIHKPTIGCDTKLKDYFLKSEYYDETVSTMFDQLEHGANLLRLLNAVIVKCEKKY